MSDLPEFDRSRDREKVRSFVRHAFSRGNHSYLRELKTYPDGHYRAVFDPSYFILGEGRTEPSRSQWNTLKKHLKRMDRQVFVFKEHGYADSGDAYVDFGFFRE